MKQYFLHLVIFLKLNVEMLGLDCNENYYSLLGKRVKEIYKYSIKEANWRTFYVYKSMKIKTEDNVPFFYLHKA